MRPFVILPAALAVAAGAGWAACGRRPDGLGFAAQDSARRLATGARPVATEARPAALPHLAGPPETIVVEVARRISPSVVSVRREDALGSGVIIQRDGVILTNAHVVGDAPVVRVGLADGRELDGRVLGRDPTVDVAVVKVEARNLPAAPLADSDRLVPGQMAIAIGNPLGLERTVTQGVVSAVNRSPRGLGLDGLIQTDAAISPGNSGGPLLNSSGEVMGINTVVIAAPGASGLGFAVPINLASDIAHQVLTTGQITRAFLGIEYRDIDEILAQEFGLPVREGIIVAAAGRGTPADRAGIREGDIITRIDGTPVTAGGDLRKVLRRHRPGDTVRLTLLRPGGERTVTVTLAEMVMR